MADKAELSPAQQRIAALNRLKAKTKLAAAKPLVHQPVAGPSSSRNAAVPVKPAVQAPLPRDPKLVRRVADG